MSRLVGRRVGILKRISGTFACTALAVQIYGLLLISDGSTYGFIFKFSLLMAVVFALAAEPRACLLAWRNPGNLSFLMLLVAIALLALLHPGARYLPTHTLSLLFLLLLYAMTSRLAVQRHLPTLTTMMTWIVIVAGTLAFAAIFTKVVIEAVPVYYRSFRLDSISENIAIADLKNPLLAGLYYGVIVVIGVVLLINKQRPPWIRLALAIATVCCVAYVYFTYARGIWISLFFALVLILPGRFSRFNLVKNPRIFLTIVASLGAVLIFLIVSENLSLTYRDEIWHNYLIQFPEFWSFGAGAHRDFVTCISAGTCLRQAHNLYFQMVYEFGLLGLLLFSVLIFHCIRICLKTLESEFSLLVLGLVFFALCAGISSFGDAFRRPGVYWVVLWMPIAFALSLETHDSKSTTS